MIAETLLRRLLGRGSPPETPPEQPQAVSEPLRVAEQVVREWPGAPYDVLIERLQLRFDFKLDDRVAWAAICEMKDRQDGMPEAAIELGRELRQQNR